MKNSNSHFTSHSQPNNWHHPFKNVPNIELKEDEIIAALVHYEITSKDTQKLFHTIFAVIRKGNFAIARLFNTDGKNISQVTEIAKYPLENENDLIQEIINDAMALGQSMLAGKLPWTLDIKKPAMVLITPKNSTNQKFTEEIEKTNEPEGIMGKATVIKLLGLTKYQKKEQLKNFQEKNQPAKQPKITLTDKIKNNRIRSKEEKNLIKKFGKKKIEDLAKKINYKGITINKDAKKITIDQLIK